MVAEELQRLLDDVNRKRISMNSRSEHRFGKGFKAARRQYLLAVQAYLPALRQYQKYQAAVFRSGLMRTGNND
jgi:hypothetical protein